ncbi:MAG: class I SAM-dependent methyltransferase [Planctomycetes bacterium]|nr:class I SAM-dependent methyltransferase [Planctomycetota bacterium]
MDENPSLFQRLRWLVRGALRNTYRLGVFYLRSRNELPHLLNRRGLVGEGAEIGVNVGFFSEKILADWRGSKLYCVDPWREFPQEEYTDRANVSQEKQDELYQQTVERLKPFGDRVELMRTTSEEAAKAFEDGQLDFVYIDAQHHYEAVKEDIALWYPKVRKGGILCGHDYLDGHVRDCLIGVKSAVDEFIGETGLKLVVSAEKDWPSWFVFV